MENLYLVIWLVSVVVVGVPILIYHAINPDVVIRPALRKLGRIFKGGSKVILAMVLFAVITGVVAPAFAQDPPKPREAAYPTVWFDQKPLPVGTHVWINYPDTACGLQDSEKYYPLLKVDRRCFNFQNNRFGFDENVYIRATITGVKERFYDGEGRYYYTLHIEGADAQDDAITNDYFRTTTWGNLFEMVNVNDERTAWGKYILILGL